MTEAAGASGASPPLAPLPTEPHLAVRSDLWFRSLTLSLALLTLVAAFGGAELLGSARDQITALVILLALLLLAAARMFTRGLSATAFNQRNNEGLTHLAEGALEAAVRDFEDLARRAKGPAVYSVVALYNLAYAEFRRGRLDRALSILSALERRPFSVFAKDTLVQAAAALQALVRALQGDVSGARAWVLEARRRPDDAKMTGYLILAEAIALVREERFEEAEALLEGGWLTASSSLTGNPYSALRLVRAYVLRRLGRSAASVREMIAGARPYRAEELAYLASVSPELARLVAENGEDATQSPFFSAKEAR